MKGLEILRVELRSAVNPIYEERVQMLRELCGVSQVRVFEVKISWSARMAAEWLRWRPFTLEGADGEIVEKSGALNTIQCDFLPAKVGDRTALA